MNKIRQSCINILIFYSSIITAYGSENKDSLHQTKNEWENLFEEILESDWNDSMEQWRDQLEELAENPLPINNANRENLESIPFLSKYQTEAMSYYLYRYGPIVDLSELLLVDGVDQQTLRLLRPFICLGDSVKPSTSQNSLKNALKYGKQEVRLSFGNTFKKNNETEYLQYAGNPVSSTFRYGFNYKERVQFGFVLQKDPGEKYLGKNYLTDYYSIHFSLRETGRIKTLIIGDYSLSLGQGLVFGKSFSLGKNFSGTNPEIYGQEIKRHFSTAESGFLRGLAGSVYLKQSKNKSLSEIVLTSFISNRKLDANLNENVFTSVSETGLHRTENELSNQNNIKLFTTGAHIKYYLKNIQLGITGIFWKFNANYFPDWKPYNNFYFRGNKGINYSANYRFRILESCLFGELSFDKNGNFASLNGLTLQPFSGINISFLARHYSPEYASYFSNAFSEGSGVRNETGYYSSIEWRFARNLRINAYCDIFIFPWLSYGINKPSTGNEKGFQIILTTGKNSEILLRIKQKIKDENQNISTTKYPEVITGKKSQFRLMTTCSISDLRFQTSLDFNSLEKNPKSNKTFGLSLSNTCYYNPEMSKISLYIRLALFDAKNFDNRIFVYEKSLPGSFSMPVFYGLGGRIGICLSYKINSNISFWVKSGYFSYTDRDMTNVSNDVSESNNLTSIQALIKWKF